MTYDTGIFSHLRSDSGNELVKDELVDVIVPNDWFTISLAWYSERRKYGEINNYDIQWGSSLVYFF